MSTVAALSNTFELPDEIHFLNRISYGPTSSAVSEAGEHGWQTVLKNQLHPEDIDTSKIEEIVAERFPTLALAPKEIVDADDEELFDRLIPDAIISSVVRQFYSPAQLFERMVEFWSDHFNTNILDDNVKFFKATDDRESIRPHALGKFRDLLHANARSPAMLLYLDNYSNTKEGPNENYARELLELHTLGVTGGYTEKDVVEVARAFTGWTISRQTLEFKFDMNLHDRGKKTLMGEPILRTYNGGITDGEQVLDRLASHPSTAMFISTKLIRRFVSDNPHPVLAEKMAQVFLDTDGDIRELLKTLFYSYAFWTSRETKMKRPLDFLASAVRRFDLPPEEPLFNYIKSKLQQLGQVPFTWHAPNGYPDTAAYWTNTAAMVNRWSTGKDTANYLSREKFLAMLGGAKTPIRIIQTMAVALIDRELDTKERHVYKKNIFTSLPPNEPVSGDPVVYARVVATVLLGSRYFQMR